VLLLFLLLGLRTKTTRGIHKALYFLTRPLRPLARLGSRPGYFARRDWATLPAGRIALVACHWIGDTFWACQVVPALQRRFPGAELFAICKPATADLWNGLVDPRRVLPAPQVVSDRRRERPCLGAIRRRARELRPLAFDLVIDLTGNRYSAAFTYWLRPAASLGFDGDEIGWLYSRRVGRALRPAHHLSERPFRVIEPLLAASANPFALCLPLRPPLATCPPRDVLAELDIPDRPYFVLAPGAGWPAKQWPAEKFVQAGAALASDGAVVVVGSAQEESLCRQVAAAIPGAKTFTGAPIGRVVALLSEAAGVLANDSGVAHLSAALGRRTAAVFTGATDERICRPLGPDDAARTFRHTDDVNAIFRHLLS
jgi:heptosyltransferase-1